MKKTITRRVNNALFGSIILMMVSSCVTTTTNQINDPRYLTGAVFDVNVMSFALADARTKDYGKKVYIASAMKDVSDNDLEFIQAAKYIENAFMFLDMYSRVAKADDADIIVRVAYGIGSPQRNSENVVVSHGYSYPVGWMWFNARPQTKTVTTTTYQRNLILEAHCLKDGDNKQIWKLNSNSEGTKSSIHTVLPYMIAASCGYIGINSGRQAECRYNTSTPDWKSLIFWILQGPQRVFTNINTEPSNATLEVNANWAGTAWRSIGNTPGVAMFWRSPGDSSVKLCRIRVSKTGYYPAEKKYPFESLPAEVNIVLQKVEE